MPTYRYKSTGASTDILNKLVPQATVFVEAGGSVFVDYTVDASAKVDLDISMESLGFTFVEEAPTTTTPQAAAQELPATYLDSGAEPSGRVLISNGAGAFSWFDISGTINPPPYNLNPDEISDSTPAPGTSLEYARGDHVHAHGDRGGGSLHDLVVPSVGGVGGVAGFMAPTDKEKLDGITGGGEVGAAVHVSLYDDPRRTTNAGPNNWQPAMGGNTLSPPEDGSYFVIFEGEGDSSSSASELQISIFKNGALVPDSERHINPRAGLSSVLTHDILVGLVTADVIEIRFQKQTGPGTVSLVHKRLTMLKVQ